MCLIYDFHGQCFPTENGCFLKQPNDIIETLLEIIKSALESGEDVLVSGFCKFQIKEKRERGGPNPAKDADMISLSDLVGDPIGLEDAADATFDNFRAQVPEPNTLMRLSMGILGMFVYYRRQRRRI